MKRTLVIGLVALLGLAVAAPVEAATITVRITKSGFAPSAVTINFGDTVRWVNNDTTNRQVVADSGAFASPILAPGRSYSYTFRTSGVFRYHDAIKPRQRGRVTVRGQPPSLTLGASQPIVVAGGSSALTGTINSGRAGENVTIYHQPYGQSSLIQLAVVQTGAGGGFSLNVVPGIFTAYQAVWRTARSQMISVQVKPKITFMPSGRRFVARVSAGAQSFAGKSIYLQRRSPFGQWVTVAKLKLGPLSGRIFSIARRKGVGFDTYRIYLTVNQAGPGFLDGNSGTQKLRRRR